ncbi:MAG: 3-oxoacyl-ACP reductase family protein [Clostridia bacterium]|nr:3-oxoacyl-ACP reductase family protein [Clostridia bacterium]
MFDLSNKVALVTGASGGLGQGVAITLAKAGADIIINYRSDDAGADKTEREITALGRKVIKIKADVSKEDQVIEMFDEIKAKFGRLDILINNAGTSKSEDIFDITLDSWESLLNTNLTSGYLCSKQAMEIMREQRNGRIIFMTSIVAHQGALKGHAHYAASKAGQIGLTKTLARTAAPYGITVNAIAPGIVKTDLLVKIHGEKGIKQIEDSIPLGIGHLEDIGTAAVFLSSDEAKYITGVTLDVNGGQYIR